MAVDQIRPILWDTALVAFREDDIRQSDQNDAGMHLPLAEHKLAEIFIAREQKTLGIIGCREYRRVRRSSPDFSKISDAEPARAQRIDNCSINALVCNEVHAAESG